MEEEKNHAEAKWIVFLLAWAALSFLFWDRAISNYKLQGLRSLDTQFWAIFLITLILLAATSFYAGFNIGKQKKKKLAWFCSALIPLTYLAVPISETLALFDTARGLRSIHSLPGVQVRTPYGMFIDQGLFIISVALAISILSFFMGPVARKLLAKNKQGS